MDKLRAIQYFNRAAEGGSFAAAARSFDVSTPAVTHLVGALERSLGVSLFHRTTRGLSLTADGEHYYETSRRVAAELRGVEERLSPRGARPRGTLTVGMRAAAGLSCVMPRVTRFVARFPDVELLIKPVASFRDIDNANLDLAVLIGWPPERDLAVRPLAQTRFVVCASPAYWMREGRPSEPKDLLHHHCLVFRNTADALLDKWTFEKEGERRTVNVRSRLFFDDRPLHDEAACAGAGIARLPDLTIARQLSSGLLVPVLADWEALEAPTIFAAYRRSQRQSKPVRAFLDFLVEIFAEIERERALSREGGIARVAKPKWYGRAQGRRSSDVTRGLKAVER
jgi:LysR family transcriptional regulator, regulator for bpeEF and oprC